MRVLTVGGKTVEANESTIEEHREEVFEVGMDINLLYVKDLEDEIEAFKEAIQEAEDNIAMYQGKIALREAKIKANNNLLSMVAVLTSKDSDMSQYI